MSQHRRRETDRAGHWRRLIASWRRSGLTQVAYCRERGISAGTFAWWKRQLAARADRSEKHESPGRRRRGSRTERFVEVCVPDSKTISAPIRMTPASPATVPVCEIVLGRGRSVRLFGSLDPASVARLITAVESAC